MPETLVRFLGWEDLLEKGKSYPLPYSGLENSMDCIVHGVTKSWTRLSDFPFHFHHWASLIVQLVKNLPAMQETWVQSLGWEDPLEKEMDTTVYSPWDRRELDMTESTFTSHQNFKYQY